MQPVFCVMFPLRSQNAILFPKYALVTEKNCEMRAQLLVDTRIRQAGASIAIVSIVTCSSGCGAKRYATTLWRALAMRKTLICSALVKIKPSDGHA
jgi:hypothetical protein